MGDTYHNRYSKDSPYKGNKKYKKFPKKCSVCGTTNGPFDLHHTSNNRKDLRSGKGLKVMCRSCHRKYHAKINGGRGSIDSHDVFFPSIASRIIEDPKTPESLAMASNHKNSDLMHVELILCHADVNDNLDRWTSEDLEASAHTAINKPINWEHKNINIGTIYASKYVKVNELNEEEKKYYKDIDPLEKDFLVCKAAIWAYKHPNEARTMKDRSAKGSLFFSMENLFEKAKCSKCEDEFSSVFEYCDHLLQRRVNRDTERIFINSNIVGGAVASVPADKLAKTLAIASLLSFNSSFSSLLGSKLLDSINVSKDIIPYILKKDVVMVIGKKEQIPEEFLVSLDDLPDESFADETNRIFPIDNLENIQESAKAILNNKLEFYDNKEKLCLVEKLAKAASEYDLEINSFIEDIGEGEKEMIDKNSPEFKQALAEAINIELTKMEDGEKVKELENVKATIEENSKIIEKQLEEAKAKKEEIEKEFNSFKMQIEKEKIATARLEQLKTKGFEFKDDSEKFVKSFIAEATEESFASFISVIEYVATAAKKKEDEEEMKKKEEEKKKEDKKNVSKANEDPVKDSKEVVIASKVGDDAEVKEDILDSIFKETLGLK